MRKPAMEISVLVGAILPGDGRTPMLEMPKGVKVSRPFSIGRRAAADMISGQCQRAGVQSVEDLPECERGRFVMLAFLHKALGHAVDEEWIVPSSGVHPFGNCSIARIFPVTEVGNVFV